MMRPELLEIVRCPETHQRLSVAPSDLVAKLNAKIAAGQLKNRVGQILTKEIDSGLIREDHCVVYPIRGGLPILLIAEALPVD